MSNTAQSPDPRDEGEGPNETFAPERRRRDSVGALLRQARLSYGNDLDSTAAALRIRPAYLAAIEEGQYDRLPGAVYALGFVRAYAAYLGLDDDEAVRRFRLETAGLERPRDLAFPMPLTKRGVPGARMLLAALVLAVCGYGLWYYLSTGDRSRPDQVAEVPRQFLPPPAPPVSAPSSATAAEAAVPTTRDTPAASSDTPAFASPVVPAPTAGGLGAPAPQPLAGTAGTTAMLPPPAAAPAQPGVASVVPPPTATPAAAPGSNARVFGAVDAPARIIIRATGDSWVQVRDAAEAVVAQRLLRQGDVYRVPEEAGLVLRTGNASSLEITVDGKPARPLGGTVRRNILLDPDRLLAGTAVSD